jgi:hypothetical protein
VSTTARAGLLFAIAALAGSAAVHAEGADTSWQFALTPYVWLPSIDAAMRYETPGNGGSEVSMSDLLKHLSGAFFLNAEARRGRWGLASDFVYVAFQKESSSVSSITGPGGAIEVPVNSGTATSLTGYMVSLTGNYSFIRGPDASLDLLAGVRYTHIGTTLDWSFVAEVADLPSRTGSSEQGVDLWDGVVGVKGNVRFGGGRKWFVPYYLDAGAGSSRFTWQGMLGAGYSFGWGDLLLVYRYLSFEQGADHDLERLSFAGPALGATFRF